MIHDPPTFVGNLGYHNRSSSFSAGLLLHLFISNPPPDHVSSAQAHCSLSFLLLQLYKALQFIVRSLAFNCLELLLSFCHCLLMVHFHELHSFKCAQYSVVGVPQALSLTFDVRYKICCVLTVFIIIVIIILQHVQTLNPVLLDSPHPVLVLCQLPGMGNVPVPFTPCDLLTCVRQVSYPNGYFHGLLCASLFHSRLLQKFKHFHGNG